MSAGAGFDSDSVTHNPMSVGVTVHLRADSNVGARLHPQENRAVQLNGDQVDDVTVFVTRAGLVHLCERVTAALAALDRERAALIESDSASAA